MTGKDTTIGKTKADKLIAYLEKCGYTNKEAKDIVKEDRKNDDIGKLIIEDMRKRDKKVKKITNTPIN